MRNSLLTLILLTSACGESSIDSAFERDDSMLIEQSIADCERGANGFIDIPDNKAGTVQMGPITLPNRAIFDLESGTISGLQRGWARIHGNTEFGDQIRMDWTTDCKKTIHHCGPFKVDYPGGMKTTAAKITVANKCVKFRACGGLNGASSLYCTDWW